MHKAIDLFLLYQLIRRMSRPFTKWTAYNLGVIDEKGNFLIPKDQRSKDQLDSLTYFDLLVLNLKKIMAKVPGGGSSIATFTAALFLLREEVTEDNGDLLIEQFLSEEGEGAPTNNMGSGHVADHENRNLLNPKSKKYNYIKQSTLRRYAKMKKGSQNNDQF